MAIIENWVVHHFFLFPLFICLISGGSHYVQMQKHGTECSGIMVLDITLAIYETMVTILLAQRRS